MYTIGITGGIGAGKSVVSKILASLNYPIFNSDVAAKQILIEDKAAIDEIKREFGEQAYTSEGALNREFLSKLIFTDDSARIRINQIVHPKVRKSFELFCENQNSSVVFNEAAILFETGSYKNFNQTILVTAPVEIRIDRVMKRDRVKRSAVEARMAAQWSDEKKAKLADFVVVNDNSQPLIRQIENVLKKITESL